MTLDEIVLKMSEKRYLTNMGAGKLSRWFKCSKEDVKEAKRIVKYSEIKHTKKPRLLFLDVETAPTKAWCFGLWDQNISIDAIASNWFILAWSAKYADTDGVMSQVLSKEEVLQEDDNRIVTTLWMLLNQVDVVCGHNIEKFDVPKIRTRFLINGLPPTKPFLFIDTLKIARKEFGFSSNKLDYIADILGVDRKMKTGMDLWVKCMSGDEESLKYMEEYNRKDVLISEEVYYKMRPFIKTHPNFNLWSESNDPVCPHCGSKNMIEETGGYYTQTAQYELHKCLDCGTISRGRKTVVPKEKTMFVSIPGR